MECKHFYGYRHKWRDVKGPQEFLVFHEPLNEKEIGSLYASLESGIPKTNGYKGVEIKKTAIEGIPSAYVAEKIESLEREKAELERQIREWEAVDYLKKHSAP